MIGLGNMKVYVLLGISVDGTECVGVFSTEEKLIEVKNSFYDKYIYSENPYDDFEVVIENLRQ